MNDNQKSEHYPAAWNMALRLQKLFAKKNGPEAQEEAASILVDFVEERAHEC